MRCDFGDVLESTHIQGHELEDEDVEGDRKGDVRALLCILLVLLEVVLKLEEV